MKIVVCVKQVIDVSFRFELDPKQYNPVEEDIFYTISPADLCASELAVKLKEKWGGEVIFVTSGPPRVLPALRSCLAMGGDKALHIWDSGLDADSPVAAHLLAKAIAPLSPDVILCGSQSIDERCAEVPATLAELLDLPQVTGVTAFEISSDKKRAIVQRKLERGRRQSIECPLPAVFAVEAGIEQPRYAGLPQLLEAYAANITPIDCQGLGLDKSQLKAIGSQRKLLSLSLPRPRPKKTFTIDSSLSADARMESLMTGGLKQSKSDLWEGKPQDLAKKLADLLVAKVSGQT